MIAGQVENDEDRSPVPTPRRSRRFFFLLGRGCLMASLIFGRGSSLGVGVTAERARAFCWLQCPGRELLSVLRKWLLER
jgi:hypothetical protein